MMEMASTQTARPVERTYASIYRGYLEMRTYRQEPDTSRSTLTNVTIVAYERLYVNKDESEAKWYIRVVTPREEFFDFVVDDWEWGEE